MEKFVQKMNEVTDYWTKSIEVQAKEGKICLVKYDGWVFKSDDEDI